MKILTQAEIEEIDSATGYPSGQFGVSGRLIHTARVQHQALREAVKALNGDLYSNERKLALAKIKAILGPAAWAEIEGE